MVVVGRFGGAHGVRGWIKIQSYTEPATNLMDYAPWQMRTGDTWQPLDVAETRPYRKSLIARINGYPDRTAVESLTGAEIGVPAAALPAPSGDEYYWRDLVGLDVVNEQGEALGQVIRLMDNGAHDLLVIRGGEGELLIPFVAAVVSTVDVDAGRIVADWQVDY